MEDATGLESDVFGIHVSRSEEQLLLQQAGIVVGALALVVGIVILAVLRSYGWPSLPQIYRFVRKRVLRVLNCLFCGLFTPRKPVVEAKSSGTSRRTRREKRKARHGDKRASGYAGKPGKPAKPSKLGKAVKGKGAREPLLGRGRRR